MTRALVVIAIVGAGLGAAALAIAGIICWLAGIAWIVGRGGAVRPAVAGGAIAAIGVVAWAAGLYNA